MIKKLFAFPIAIILALIIIKPYYHAGFPYTHDGENHLARFANYKIAVREGQIPPRFAPNLMNHYGYPVFNYNYPLANILSLPFSFLKINYEVTFKILAGILVLLGLVGVYHWLDRLQMPFKAMMFGTTVYALSPYLWSTILYRGNIGEIMAWGLFPWLFYFVESLRSYNNISYKFKSLIIAAFLLSHNVAVLFGIPLVLLYAFLRYKFDRIFWIRLATALGFGIALTLWFWLPAVTEKNLVTVGEVGLVSSFTSHFPTLKQLIVSPLSFGFSQPGSIDSLSFSLGLIQIVLLLISSIMIFKALISKALRQRKTLNNSLRLLSILVASCLWLVIFQLKLTKPIWELIPLVSFIQFPWRLSLFLGVFWAGIGALIWTLAKTNLKLVLIGLLIIQFISYLKAKPVDYFHRTNVDYDAFSQSTTTKNENLPKSFTYLEIADWQPRPVVLTGDVQVKVDYWTGSDRQYTIIAHTPAVIVEPTMYFAGWQTVADFNGEQKQLTYVDNEQIQGRIGYELEAVGTYELRSEFTQRTWPRMVGNAVSVVSIVCFISVLLLKSSKSRIAI